MYKDVTKGTPEPWRVEEGEEACFHKGNRVSIVRESFDGEPVIETVAEVWPGGPGQDVADGRKIVAAVNACAGIPVEALEDGVVGDLLAAAKALLTLTSDDPTYEDRGHNDALRNAIAKIEEG